MRTILTSLSLCALVGVASAAGPATNDARSRANERTVRALFAALNRHDLEAVAALYAPDAELRSSDFEGTRRGPEGVRMTYDELLTQLVGIHDEVTTLIVDGDRAAVEFVSTWPANGKVKAGRLPIATFFRFRDGRIVSDVTYFDVPKRGD